MVLKKLLLLQPFYGHLSGTTRVSRYQKKYSPTDHPDHHPIFISFFHLLRSIASSLFNLRAWQSFAQPLSKSSLVYLLVWSPPLHTPYISSPNECLLFATHAHTIITCFAVVPRLYHLYSMVRNKQKIKHKLEAKDVLSNKLQPGQRKG